MFARKIDEEIESSLLLEKSRGGREGEVSFEVC
jgi:hypothetical protein